MQNYKQPGHILTLTAPSGGVESGGGVQIGRLFVVATNDADEGDEFEGHTVGVFVLPKATGQAWAEGDALFWDSTPGEATTTETGNLFIGCAIATTASGATEGEVRLNGTVRPATVNAAALGLFISAEQTGTGSAQNVAHGLGVTPSKVFVAPTDTAPATTGAYTVTEGTHTSTNVVVTVTSGKKFKVLALI